jgi:DNA polymerase
MTKDDLRRRLEFYQDLGIKTYYRRPRTQPLPEPAPIVQPEAQVVAIKVEQVIPPVAPVALIPLAPEGDTLLRIREDIGDCKRCRLHEARHKIVFGSGSDSARLVFVGEGPGADEDAQGLPFVGRAGQLLTQMIDGTASKEGIPIRALGSTAAKAILGTKEGVTRLRGKWHKWHDIPVMVTYHPSYLLRPYNQNAKREAWEDLKKVLHYVYD